MRHEVVHVEQDVEALSADAAVAEERVDRVVPAQQRVAVRQRLRGLVVGAYATGAWSDRSDGFHYRA